MRASASYSQDSFRMSMNINKPCSAESIYCGVNVQQIILKNKERFQNPFFVEFLSPLINYGSTKCYRRLKIIGRAFWPHWVTRHSTACLHLKAVVLNLPTLGTPISKDSYLGTPLLRLWHESKWWSLLFVHLWVKRKHWYPFWGTPGSSLGSPLITTDFQGTGMSR